MSVATATGANPHLFQRLPEGFGKRVAGEVIECRAEASGNEQDPGTTSRSTEFSDDVRKGVGKCGMAGNDPAERLQFTTEPLAVGVKF